MTMDEDWPLLVSFFPDGWGDMAADSGALKGLRKDKSPENLLRTLLIHFGCGHSLRETVVRAREAGIADLSDVALLKRLRKSKDWLYTMCVALFQERGVALASNDGFQVRAFDATTVKEPGKTGSLWRIHYSVSLPSLNCDFFKLTETEGVGTGESFSQFAIKEGDYIIADRGYSTANGIHYATVNKAFVTVRVNTAGLPLRDRERKDFDLLEAVKTVTKPGISRAWSVVAYNKNQSSVDGRLCVIRKSEEAIKLAQEKIRKEASKKGRITKPETLEYAKYIILFTTFPEDEFSPAEILEWYRIRWQVELVFKRFKSLAQLGHLPKQDDESAKAWLYGKLFVALVVEKLIEHACSVSPWGYLLEEFKTSQRMERV
jgi:hypothetical protein